MSLWCSTELPNGHRHYLTGLCKCLHRTLVSDVETVVLATLPRMVFNGFTRGVLLYLLTRIFAKAAFFSKVVFSMLHFPLHYLHMRNAFDQHRRLRYAAAKFAHDGWLRVRISEPGASKIPCLFSKLYYDEFRRPSTLPLYRGDILLYTPLLVQSISETGTRASLSKRRG